MRAIQSDVSRAGCRPVPVAIYTRVSTINQVGGRFDSCESQASICREFLGKHTSEGWYEAASFSDPAYSGGSMNRPGFQALKRQIEAGDIKIVLIFKLERVLRSTDEWTPLRAFLQKHGCRLVRRGLLELRAERVFHVRRNRAGSDFPLAADRRADVVAVGGLLEGEQQIVKMPSLGPHLKAEANEPTGQRRKRTASEQMAAAPTAATRSSTATPTPATALIVATRLAKGRTSLAGSGSMQINR
jgi:hypothetical protein